jgi:hypothetical protein
MIEFLKKAMDWVLEKEKDAANDCHINPKDVDKQITYMEEKRDKIKKECEDSLSELEHILNRLHAIKAKSLTCQTKQE